MIKYISKNFKCSFLFKSWIVEMNKYKQIGRTLKIFNGLYLNALYWHSNFSGQLFVDSIDWRDLHSPFCEYFTTCINPLDVSTLMIGNKQIAEQLSHCSFQWFSRINDSDSITGSNAPVERVNAMWTQQRSQLTCKENRINGNS